MTGWEPVEVVGLDADDTLWHSEPYFERVMRRYLDLVGRYVDPEVDLRAALVAVDLRNVDRYGYGFKAFILSLIEAAIEVTGGAIGTDEVADLLHAGREMLDHPVHLLDGVAEAVEELAAAGHRLVVVTKGDLVHQQHKLVASGLLDRFERVEIVAEKDPPTYQRVVEALGVAPERFLMVGNSVKSDVLPVLEIGGRAVHVPYHLTWEGEIAEHDGSVPELASLRELPGWLAARRPGTS